MPPPTSNKIYIKIPSAPPSLVWQQATPSPRSVDGALLLAGSFFNFILRSAAMHLHDTALNLFKLMLREAFVHHRHHAYVTPLLPTAGDQSGSGSESFRNLFVIGSFAKGLVVRICFNIIYVVC
jgi:hypothetical protein